jgi:colanic acid/amylovoran biosynthesis glycosyltransferase
LPPPDKAGDDGAWMRIAYLISQYPAINHTYILGEIQGLRKQGLTVDTISISAPDRPLSELNDTEKAEQAGTFYVKRRGVVAMAVAHLSLLLRAPLRYVGGLAFALRMSGFTPGEVPRWLLFFVQAVLVGQQVEKLGLNRLHVHYASSVGLLVGRLFPILVSHTIHGSGEFENPRTFRLREKTHFAQMICTISRFGRSQVWRFSDPEDWGKVEVCPLGVDVRRFQQRGGRSRDDGVFELITVGQLAPAKGQHIMVEAVSLLRRRGMPVRLRLVGDGAMRRSLEEQAKRLGVEEDVIFAGFRNNAQLSDLYRDADAFVMSSFAEGLPVAMMEAMAMGLPCLASRITGIPELVADGETGILVTPSDAAELAAAVERLRNDRELRQRMGEAGRRKVELEYNIETNTARLAQILQGLRP